MSPGEAKERKDKSRAQGKKEPLQGRGAERKKEKPAAAYFPAYRQYHRRRGA